jgi:hypothetical protein
MYEDVIGEGSSSALPPLRPCLDCKINLKPSASLPAVKPIYRFSELESQELRKYIDDSLFHGWIVPSTSLVASPIFFVSKPGSNKPRLCVDYRALNNITIRDLCPLFLIDNLVDRLRGATIFTKIDLRQAYHQVRIAPGQKYITTFRCQFGQFKYKVMSFGLTNVLVTFMRLVNHIFSDLLTVCVVVYLDDILVFSRTQDEHLDHVKLVVNRFRLKKLYAKFDKCEFFMSNRRNYSHRRVCDARSIVRGT